MNEEYGTATLTEKLGAFHVSIILLIVAIIGVMGFIGRLRGKSVSGHWRIAFMLGVAVFFWGRMWAANHLSVVYGVRANPNTGFHPGNLENALSEVHGISMMYSGLAFCSVVLAMGIAMMGRIGRKTDLKT